MMVLEPSLMQHTVAGLFRALSAILRLALVNSGLGPLKPMQPRETVSHQQLNLFKDILQDLEALATSRYLPT